MYLERVALIVQDESVGEPRMEPYGRVAVLLDIAGNGWDLLGPPQVAP
jgi:hypothetical protein